MHLRDATAHDADLLLEMLVLAATWRPGSTLTSADALAQPELARYVAGWQRDGDVGVVAVDDGDRPLGAAWLRVLPAAEPGYGYVAADVPELSVAVRTGERGRGVGRALVVALLQRARQAGTARVSLSVEPDNHAVGLYRDLGFVPVATTGTMVCHLI